MNDFNKIGIKKNIALFLRGGSGVGKSALANALVGLIPLSAKIDVDGLRYMISGGLVASKSNVKPFHNPKEYLRQCRLADKNAFALTRNFLDAGFIPVIDGMNGGESSETYYYMKKISDIQWYPHPTVFAREMPGIKIFQIVLDAHPDVLYERLKLKSHDDETINFILSQRVIFLRAVTNGQIDYMADTSKNNPDFIAKQIIEKFML